MNARAIKKKLMRNRFNSLFGRRAFLTIALPIDFFGPPSLYPVEWGQPGCCAGDFEDKDHFHRVFSKVYGSIESIKANLEDGDVTKYHFVTLERDYDFDPRWKHVTWWEGIGTTDDFTNRVQLPKSEVETYRKYTQWQDKVSYDPRICEIDRWCKTSYVNISKDRTKVTITFSVKWFYPKRKLGFCRALSRFMKEVPCARFCADP